MRKSDFEKVFSKWVGKQLQTKGFFTKAEACKKFKLDPNNTNDWMKAYNLILKWRKKAISRWDVIDSEGGLKQYGDYTKLWDAFLDIINSTYNEFLIFSHETRFYQPARLEKEVIDFLRVKKKTKSQLTVLKEMDKFEESFESIDGTKIKPKEIMANIQDGLGDLKIYIDGKLDKEIKELAGGKKLGNETEGN